MVLWIGKHFGIGGVPKKIMIVTPELILAAQQGGLQAFNCLIQAYQDRIYNLVCRLVADEHRAEELTQAAVQRLYHDLPTYHNGEFYPWLLKILVKVCRPAMQCKRTAGHSDQPLLDTLEALSPNLRLVIVLVDMEGLDYAQTAAILGIPKRTVSTRLAKARGQLSGIALIRRRMHSNLDLQITEQ